MPKSRRVLCELMALSVPLSIVTMSIGQETQVRYGSVVQLQYEKRILTMLNQSGGSILRLKIADDVEYRRLDDGPKELRQLKPGDRVRVEFEESSGELPTAVSILASSPKIQPGAGIDSSHKLPSEPKLRVGSSWTGEHSTSAQLNSH